MLTNAIELRAKAPLEADAIIVGSGPAGLIIAMELAKRGRKVIVLEGGLVEWDEDFSSLAASQIDGFLDSGHLALHSARMLGGSSSLWNGWCATFEREAFAARENCTSPAWPFPYEELYQYYEATRSYLDLPPQILTETQWPLEGISGINVRPFYFSPPTRFAEKYVGMLRATDNIQVVLGAVVTDIRLTESLDYVDQLRFVSRDLMERNARAPVIVLAAGGAGNTRLLLASNGQIPGGIGSLSGWLGAGFMEHPHIYDTSPYFLKIAGKVLRILNEGRPEGLERYETAVQLTPDQQHNNKLMCASINIYKEQDMDDPLAEYDDATMPGGARQMRIIMRTEMEARKENRLRLGTAKDWSGVPMLVGNVGLSDNDLRSIRRSLEVFHKILRRRSLSRATRPTWELATENVMGGGHLMGATRMGTSARNSVVDPDCRLHGIDNLYISGCSVFPSCAASNPTFTLSALAVRLSAHLLRDPL